MARRTSNSNAFYVLLVVAGIVFAITACAYGVMSWRAMRFGEPTEQDGALMLLLGRHGTKLLGVELAVLAVGTIGAILSDARGEED